MIYKYNVAYTNKKIPEDIFNKIKQKIKNIRNCEDQEFNFGRHILIVSEKTETLNLNTCIVCSKAKAFYAIGAIRTDENYINQWMVLKYPTDGYKRIFLNKTESVDTSLYRRMTVEEIKDYTNDHEYDA